MAGAAIPSTLRVNFGDIVDYVDLISFGGQPFNIAKSTGISL